MSNTATSTLPKAPDAVILELLARARFMFEHAISHSQGASTLDRMITIHGLDNTVEYLLRIVIKHLDIEAETNTNLDSCELTELAGTTNKYLRNKHDIVLPYFTEIKHLRQIRNMVQHQSADPGVDLKRHIQIVDRFSDKILTKIFGINKNQIRLSTLVADLLMKEFLEKAEENIANCKWLDAVVASRDAFENALYKHIVRSSLRLSVVPALTDPAARSFGVQILFTWMRDELEIVKLGVNPLQYEKFKKYMLHIPLAFKANSGQEITLNREWAEADAEFCYNFSTDVILKWQSGEQEPIITVAPEQDRSRTLELTLNEIDLIRKFEGGCSYQLEDGKFVVLMYGDKGIYDKFSNLHPGSIYEYRNTEKINGVRIREIRYKVIVDTLTKQMITNNPARWEIIIAWTLVPFTYSDTSFNSAGTETHTSAKIDRSTAEELTRGVPYLTPKTAEKLVELRSTRGIDWIIENFDLLTFLTTEQKKRLKEYTGRD